MNAPFLPGRGFADPVLGSQATFRAVLEAMSRPGRVVPVPQGGVSGPDLFPGALLSILLTLVDHETPVWLDAEARASALPRWLAFHAHAPLADAPARAAFAVLRAGTEPQPLSSFALGDPRYPDRSTTVLVLCEGFEGGADMLLEGPGIETSTRWAPRGLPAGFVEQAQENHARAPLGVDCLLVAGNTMCGLPRSTRILTEPR